MNPLIAAILYTAFILFIPIGSIFYIVLPNSKV